MERAVPRDDNCLKKFMKRLLSTYLFVSRKLNRELLGQIAEAGFSGVEIFCSRAHFDYTSKTEAREIGSALADLRLTLTSQAMDELKRAIDVAEDLPFPRMIFHMGGTRETADERKRDAAFSSLEHLILHAKHVGVTICVENTTSEMGDPEYLRTFYDETRLTGLRFNFDIGHAYLADGAEDERIEKAFAPLRDLVVGAHIHDNHGEKDEHLPPYDGTIDWENAIKVLKTAPANDLPLLLELKEKTGPEALSAHEQLAAASKAWDKFEEEWE